MIARAIACALAFLAGWQVGRAGYAVAAYDLPASMMLVSALWAVILFAAGRGAVWYADER